MTLPATPPLRLRRLGPFLLLAAALAMLQACAPFAVFTETVFMMTPEEELRVGAQLEGEVTKQFRINRMPEVNRYIDDLGQRLWLNSAKGPIAPTFHVVDDDAINAFAIPGGAIYVHTGAILAAADEAELAGVIAHEIGHVVRRHGARAMSREAGLQVVQQILLGEQSGEASRLLGNLLAQGVMFRYSRDDELESDAIAVETLYRAGYDPTALRTFFATLVQRYGDRGSGPVAKLFASHPPTRERMDRVAELAARLPDPPRARPRDRLQSVQARLPRPVVR